VAIAVADILLSETVGDDGGEGSLLSSSLLFCFLLDDSSDSDSSEDAPTESWFSSWMLSSK